MRNLLIGQPRQSLPITLRTTKTASQNGSRIQTTATIETAGAITVVRAKRRIEEGTMTMTMRLLHDHHLPQVTMRTMHHHHLLPHHQVMVQEPHRRHLHQATVRDILHLYVRLANMSQSHAKHDHPHPVNADTGRTRHLQTPTLHHHLDAPVVGKSHVVTAIGTAVASTTPTIPTTNTTHRADLVEARTSAAAAETATRVKATSLMTATIALHAATTATGGTATGREMTGTGETAPVTTATMTCLIHRLQDVTQDVIQGMIAIGGTETDMMIAGEAEGR
jgi:hypothetical protein